MKLSVLLASAALALVLPATAMADTGYYRTPSIAAGQIAFDAEQSVWLVPQAGGEARRLTASLHVDPHPMLSVDGRQVAFLSDIDGPTELYVMPVSGGVPKRITYENRTGRTAPLPIGWTATGTILYAATPAIAPSGSRVVASIDPGTGERHVYSLADANDAALSPDGKTLYFVRFGTAISGDHIRTYRGGAVAQLWRFDLANGQEAERIGNQAVNLRRPMLWRDRLIVISDQDGWPNLWSLALDGTDPHQLTHHADFSVQDARIAGDRIAYQLGADLYTYDLAQNSDAQVPVSVSSDRAARRPQWLDHPLRTLTDVDIAPNGQDAILTFRGHVVLAGTGPRRRILLADAPGVRLRHAAASPDGKWIYAFSDQPGSDHSGESEIWRYPTDGSAAGTQLTHGNRTEPTGLYVAPDGAHLVHTDMLGRLWLLDLAGKGGDRLIEDASKDGAPGYDSIVWSADGQALAFSRNRGENIREQIAVYRIGDASPIWVTGGKYHSHAPSFSPDGHWLYFLSDRHFEVGNGSPWGDRNTQAAFPKRTGIYALALQAGLEFPFQPHSELDATKAADAKPAEGKGAKHLPAIVTDGLADRLYHVPVAYGDYQSLAAGPDYLYALDGTEDTNPLKSIHIDRDDPKIETFAPDIGQADLTPDGKTLLLTTPGKGNTPPHLVLVPAGAKMPGDVAHQTIGLEGLRLWVDPGAEWAGMLQDAWRLRRDHFYDRNLRGVDWQAVRARYAPLAERVSDRSDLDDLLGQMVGELGALHSQLRSADTDKRAPSGAIAGLGAQFERVKEGFRIAHIDASDPELPEARPPLARPGVDAREGDIITAVNGQSVAGLPDLSSLLADQAGHEVLLVLRRNGHDIRTIVRPASVSADAGFGYTDWELGRAKAVQDASGGRIGYVHLRSMVESDIATFTREFYANLDRDGIVIDVRRNQGGNVDSWILGDLLRKAWMFWGRYGTAPSSNMQQAFRGHIVVLCDEMTYSDGETFSQGVKALKIGPLVGMRTAGAGVWLSDGDRLIDSGTARTAENPQFDMNGKWLVENHGVEPDVSVENMPHATYLGHDQQLEHAIGMLQAQIKAEPVRPMVPEPFPKPQ